MSRKERRVSVKVSYDEQREAEIGAKIDDLSNRSKLGPLASHLLTLLFETPEVYASKDRVMELLKIMDQMGTTPTRNSYFVQIAKEFEQMKLKIDLIYDLAYKTYILAQVGKRIGLEEKADNELRASFLLERQINSICDKIGVDNLNHTFISNKLQDTHSKADEVLEYIIESYDGIIGEIKASQQVQMIPSSIVGVSSAITTPAVQEVASSTQLVDANREVIKKTSEEIEKAQTDEEDEIELTENPRDKYEDSTKITNIDPTSDRAALLMKAMMGKSQ